MHSIGCFHGTGMADFSGESELLPVVTLGPMHIHTEKLNVGPAVRATQHSGFLLDPFLLHCFSGVG